MPANFAALENRTAQAVWRHLFNASANGTGAGGAALAFDVAFDDAYGAVAGMEASAPQALALSVNALEVPYQTVLTITRKGEPAGSSFAVVNKEPDGTGLTRLILERVA
jgi:hypothetical protein